MYRTKRHLIKIFAVCKLTPETRHWLTHTRSVDKTLFASWCPDNLVIRFSAPMVDQDAPGSWPNTSTVVTAGATCPAPTQENECKDCRACWDPEVKNVAYGHCIRNCKSKYTEITSRWFTTTGAVQTVTRSA